MDLELGVVCGRCDRYAPMGTASCATCSNALALEPQAASQSKTRAASSSLPAALGGAPAVVIPAAPAVPARAAPAVPARAAPAAPARAALPPDDSGMPPGPSDLPSALDLPGPVAPARLPKQPAPTMDLGRSVPDLSLPPAVSPHGTRGSPAEPAPFGATGAGAAGAAGAAGTVVARAAYSDRPPPSLLGQEPLVPRRHSGPLRAASSPAEMSLLSPVPEDGTAASQRAVVVEEPGEPVDLHALATSLNLTLEELMDQAKNFVCRSCSTPVPVGHKFCGRCGAAMPPEILAARTQFFGQLQSPGKAKLILIRGEGVEGLSYQLNAEQHVVGRNGQLVFPDDPFVSPKHANLFYRNGKLVVRDEGSLNGVYVRVRGTVDIAMGDSFLAGEQLFKFDGNPKANDGPAPDGTYFYSSPKHQTNFRITQILQGGALGMCVCARGQSLQIGREGGELNFPGDLYMSASHCKIEEAGGKYTLTDLNSRNGTYLRLKAERELAHGDYLFIGRKLLRVEITAA